MVDDEPVAAVDVLHVKKEVDSVMAENVVVDEPAIKSDEIAETAVDETEDGLGYTKRGDYTCEMFKVELKNLPKHISYTVLKKLFKNKVKVTPQKIKLIGKMMKFAFVALRSEEDREKTLKELDGYEWKGSVISCHYAKPVTDPFFNKRKDGRDGDDRDRRDKRPRISTESLDPEAMLDTINDKSAPLWKMSYGDQLRLKTTNTKEFLVDLHKDIGKVMDGVKHLQLSQAMPENEDPLFHSRKLFAWYMTAKKNYDRQSCPIANITPSPVVLGYRNKCEFSIGSDRTVGFRLGTYKEGTVQVAPVSKCPIVSDVMNSVCVKFEEFLKSVSKLEPYSNVTQLGNWKQLTVRTTRLGQIMIIAVLHPQQLAEEDIVAEKKLLSDFFANSGLNVTSVYLQVYQKKLQDSKNENVYELLTGKSVITETLEVSGKQLEFEIGPDAFWQTNSAAAELCYQRLADLVETNDETILLDICCGTGTIGLCMASKVARVIGLELNTDAVNNARLNAKRNGIDNIEFISGKAEIEVPLLLSRLASKYGLKNVVAVVDPPRAGLNSNVMKALRATESLKKLIYVSCEPKTAKHNLIDLCRPPSKQYKGEPFVPIIAIPIDMFPQTRQCEVIFVYERLSSSSVKTDTQIEQNVAMSNSMPIEETVVQTVVEEMEVKAEDV